ncbi:MAG: NAD(P)H-quinone oxidoreductase subunit chloroplastic [Pseudomonadota bacterium]
MSENEGGFFSRWSQRKQAVKAGLVAEDKADKKLQEPVQTKAAPLATAHQDAAESKAEPVKLPTLADVEQLTPQSDFSAFMTQGVTPEVRNAAMKKLFTDPHYNVMDGLDIYIGDYNTPDPMPAGMLAKMVGAQFLGLVKAPEDVAQSNPLETSTQKITRHNMTTLICDCNQTMPLQTQKLGQALGESLTLHSTLCRREAGAFQKAIQSGQEVVVACTQEKKLFSELASQTEGATSPIKFVNIREAGGWSSEAQNASPKLAALLAAAHLPEPDPVPAVPFKSEGRLLIIGPLDQAEKAAAMVADVLQVTIFAQGAGEAGGSQERQFPIVAGQLQSLSGWLGAFDVSWTDSNPINLDLCTRCNACVQACPENAIGLDYQIDMNLCNASRACVKVCQSAGAIDFNRVPSETSEKFDLILDLRQAGATGPQFLQHAPPQGYFKWDGRDLTTLIKLRDMVGEFEKPKFFAYKQKLCAHSRNETVGCNACVDICSAEAISSDKSRQQIKVLQKPFQVTSRANKSRSTPICAWVAALALLCAQRVL